MSRSVSGDSATERQGHELGPDEEDGEHEEHSKKGAVMGFLGKLRPRHKHDSPNAHASSDDVGFFSLSFWFFASSLMSHRSCHE